MTILITSSKNPRNARLDMRVTATDFLFGFFLIDLTVNCSFVDLGLLLKKSCYLKAIVTEHL